ncbi:MAG: hypothetical protein JW995_10280 [Melioribacteraceae bacterium]|nr:hypothetical protein [Melioribacteraceae bacterium]
MKNEYDDMMNKYLDGELNQTEINELNDMISRDTELLEKLKAYKLVDKHLKDIEPDTTPADFTIRFMERLNTVSEKLESNKFFYSIITFFFISIVGSLVFLFTYFSEPTDEYNKTEYVIEKLNNYSVDIIGKINEYFVNFDVSVALVSASLICMLGLYFLYEFVKGHKRKVEALHN